MNGDPERTMKEELEDALGQDVSDGEAQAALERSSPTLAHWLREQQLEIAIGAGAAIVVGAIISLALDSWIFLVLAVLVHGIVTLTVGYIVLRVTTEVEKPSPVTVARLQAQGVDDPEAKLNMAIQAHEDGHANRVRDALGVDAEDRDGGDAADQQVANTPSSEETELVGPDLGRRNGKN